MSNTLDDPYVSERARPWNIARDNLAAFIG